MDFLTLKIMMTTTISLLMAVFFFVIGGTVLIRKKPLVVSSRCFFGAVVLAFTPLIVNPLIFFVEPFTKNSGNIGISWIMLLSPLMFLFLLVFFWFQIQGYMLFGITDETVRDALHYGLQKLNSPFEEILTKIKLSELDTELQISLQSWMGTGLIKIKDRSKRAFLTKLAQHMRIYFKEHDIPTKNITVIFYMIMGGFMTLLTIGMFVMRIKMYLRGN
ncbi:MAG: hypothetical protein GY845_33015 [Planctomycetes bacterium]|nr:hypothetical protein [Planctomycetota bacterium]